MGLVDFIGEVLAVVGSDLIFFNPENLKVVFFSNYWRVPVDGPFNEFGVKLVKIDDVLCIDFGRIVIVDEFLFT